MKKLISLALAAIFALSLGTCVFAKQGGVVASNKSGNNAVTLESDSNIIAKLYFKGDTSGDKFYFGVVTDWKDSPYQDAFSDQDACLISFQLDGVIPAASLPSLYIYNPFADKDGESAVDVSDIVIYKATKTGLSNVTKDFTALTLDDNHTAFAIRTRMPGTYIFAEHKIDPASADKIAADSAKEKPKPVKKAVPSRAMVMPSRAAK